jgi:FkbM family methyltransferase
MKTYSFEGQDCISKSLLRLVENGTYIDVGANHPMNNNNTYLFYQKGWKGLAIEGNNDFQKIWVEKRPRDRFINELVSNEVKKVNFEIYIDKEISSIDEETKNRYKSRINNKEEIKSLNLMTTTIDKIINNENYQKEEIHLLSIDVEGEDYNVLKGINFENQRPGLIVIENKNFNINKDYRENIIYNFMVEKKYILISKTPLDSFFIDPMKSYFKWIPENMKI